MNKIFYDVLIIGGGPGGMTAAIYAKRSNLSVAFIEKSGPGGKMLLTSSIENYPGFEKISGAELSLKIYNQTKSLGILHIYGEVISFDKEDDNFSIKTKDGKIYFSKTIIIATGMSENKFGVPGEEKLIGKGISYCAICDSAFYKNKEIAVLGGGNSALKEAIFLSKIAKKVHLIHRFDYFEGQKIEIDLIKSIDNIEIKTGQEVQSFNGENKLESITYKDAKNGKETTLNIDGAFSYIGYKPITNYVNEELVELDKSFVVTDDFMKTKTPGIFAIGSLRFTPYRQIIITESNGILAALEAEKYINEKNKS